MAENKFVSLRRLQEFTVLIKQEIANAVLAVKNDLLNGAGPAYDTLKELGDLIDTNQDAIDALEALSADKADAVHSHAIADVTGLQDALSNASSAISANTSSIEVHTDKISELENVIGLPTVSESDEGKVLRVVSGVWSLVETPNCFFVTNAGSEIALNSFTFQTEADVTITGSTVTNDGQGNVTIS